MITFFYYTKKPSLLKAIFYWAPRAGSFDRLKIFTCPKHRQSHGICSIQLISYFGDADIKSFLVAKKNIKRPHGFKAQSKGPELVEGLPIKNSNKLLKLFCRI